MAYTYDPIFAKDPGNPNLVASNAVITLFDPEDPTQAPITITDPTGVPLTNPVTVDANGMGPAFQHATLARVGWTGGGFTNYFTSYEDLKNEAVAAREAAETAAANTASTVKLDQDNTFSGAHNVMTGRLGVGTDAYGANRLGDSPFQTTAIDVQSVNVKDGLLNTLAALFGTSGPGFVVTTLKSFTGNDHVFRIVGKPRNVATEDGAAVLSLINEDATEANVEGLDLFAQRFLGSSTAVAQTAGIVMLQEGTGKKLDFGFWYKTPGAQTYTRVYNIDRNTFAVTFDKPVTVPAAVADSEATNLGQVKEVLAAATAGPAGQRGSRWWVANKPYATYTDVVGMIEGDIFLYPDNRAMFVFTEGEWSYGGTLAA